MRTHPVRRIAVLLLLVLAAGCGTGGKSAAIPPDFKTYTDKEHGFQISLPSSWNYSAKDTMARSKLAAGAKESAVVSILAAEMPDDLTARQYIDRTTTPEKFKKQFLNGEFAENANTKLNGEAAVRTVILYDQPGWGRTRATSFTMVKDKRLYLMNASVPAADYDKYAKDIEAIGQTFRIIDRK